MSDLRRAGQPKVLNQFVRTLMTAAVDTVSAHIEPRGSIFQNEFLGGVLLIFGIGGVVIKMGFY